MMPQPPKTMPPPPLTRQSNNDPQQQSLHKAGITGKSFCQNTSNLFGKQNIHIPHTHTSNYSGTHSTSTLSLHISAYENSIDASDNNDSVNNDQKCDEKLIYYPKKTETAFEIPRQQENNISKPEVMDFKASQKLLNPNSVESNRLQSTGNEKPLSGIEKRRSELNKQFGRLVIESRKSLMVFMNDLDNYGFTEKSQQLKVIVEKMDKILEGSAIRNLRNVSDTYCSLMIMVNELFKNEPYFSPIEYETAAHFDWNSLASVNYPFDEKQISEEKKKTDVAIVGNAVSDHRNAHVENLGFKKFAQSFFGCFQCWRKGHSEFNCTYEPRCGICVMKGQYGDSLNHTVDNCPHDKVIKPFMSFDLTYDCTNCLRKNHTAATCKCPARCKNCFTNNRRSIAHPTYKCPYVSCQHCGGVGHEINDCYYIDQASKCHRCKQAGHTDSQCTSEIVCNFCGESGHKYKFCPFRS